MEELLEAEVLKVANKEKTIQVLGESKLCAGFFSSFFFSLFISFSEYHLISCVCLTLHFMSFSVFPLSNFVCFVIVKDLKQEIEALKEEIGNIQLEKAQQVKIPEP